MPTIFHSTGRLFVDAIYNAFVLLGAAVASGLAVSGLTSLLKTVTIAILGPSMVNIIINYLMLPGVIHHELSHAVAALLTGARIKGFSITPHGSALGSVEITARGPTILRGLQLSLSAIAPVLFGVLTLYVMYRIYPNVHTVPQRVLFWYLAVSILLHMTLSGADWKCFYRGVVGTYVVLLVVCLVAGLAKSRT